MKRQLVESSNLTSIGYDQDTSVLEVEFKRGSVYKYLDVPLETYEEMIGSESLGKAFVNLIKGGGFKYERLSDRYV